jgi:hypothetical protein
MKQAAFASSIEFEEALATVGSALQSAFPEEKAFAIGVATMNLAVAISKALAMEGPLGWAEVAKIAAAGITLLGTIRSATMSSSGGGVPSVGGGSGGAAAQPPAPPMQMLTVQGLNAGQIFTGEAMRALAQQMIQFQKDGGQVIIK